jgi:hypothetical protein
MQVNHFPGDEFSPSVLCRPYNHALQNAGNAGVSPFIRTRHSFIDAYPSLGPARCRH